MSNENWTPGPWKAHETKTRCVTFEGKWGEENLFLEDSEGYYSCQSEQDANLIAAAPDLYKALKALTLAVNSCAPDARDEISYAESMAKEALYKARGEK